MKETRTGKFIFPALLFGCCLLLLPAAATPGELPVQQFQSAQDFAAWRGEGIEAFGAGPEGIQIQGKEQFRLFSPSGSEISDPSRFHLRIRLRVHSPRYFRVFGQEPDGRVVLATGIVQPPLDANFHVFWIPLAEGPELHRKSVRLGLAFGGRPGLVEIDSIEIRPFSVRLYFADQWRGFWLPRKLGLGSINSLSSPRIFGQPLVSWLNLLAAAVILLGLIRYLRVRERNRIRIVRKVALGLLLIWIVYDLRETFSQYQVLQEIHTSYVQPPPGEKTFPALGNFYEFVDLCREVIPENAQYNFYSRPMWPFDCRVQYFLYPRGIKSDTWNRYISAKGTPYHVVYRDPSVEYDPGAGRLRRRGGGGSSFISGPGAIISRFEPISFIFLEEEADQ